MSAIPVFAAARDHWLRLARLVRLGELEPCPCDQRDTDGTCLDCEAPPPPAPAEWHCPGCGFKTTARIEVRHEDPFPALVHQALILREYGETPAEKWWDWEQRAERALRGLPTDPSGGAS